MLVETAGLGEADLARVEGFGVEGFGVEGFGEAGLETDLRAGAAGDTFGLAALVGFGLTIGLELVGFRDSAGLTGEAQRPEERGGEDAEAGEAGFGSSSLGDAERLGRKGGLRRGGPPDPSRGCPPAPSRPGVGETDT